jgi:ATP-dependent DNA ligase
MLAAAQGLEEKKKVLMRFVVGLSAMQNKWICRIILKDMKLGLKADPILKFMHPDALDAFNASSSLKLVCGLLLDPSVRIAQRISFFRPFKPMLAKRKVRKTCLDSMKNSAFIIEKKWDGERMLIHKNGTEVKYFTRNCNDYTALYGASLTPHVLECVKADKAILDAEVMVWDGDGMKCEDFGTLKTAANEITQNRARGIMGGETKWLVLMVFDCLWCNGADDGGAGGAGGAGRAGGGLRVRSTRQSKNLSMGSLLGLTLGERRDVLAEILAPKPNYVEFPHGEVVSELVSRGDRLKAVEVRQRYILYIQCSPSEIFFKNTEK